MLALLEKNIQDFINQNIGVPISKLALQKNPFTAVPWISILTQIESKTKAKEKLPQWFLTPNILYPAKISIEQTSSEKTALFKSSLINGDSLIDLTGGLGIDAYYFSKKTTTVAHCEINPELSALVTHNFEQLKATNINTYSGDSYEILKKISQKWDWIYIDPSRRSDSKGKVFLLKDCLPNVPENQDFYFNYTDKILIKTAPLLDLSSGLSELKNVKNIHIIALENEVKEILWEIHKNYTDPVFIKTTNLTKEKTETFEYVLGKNIETINYSPPKKYLFEPNSAIMKSGGFEQIGLQYGLEKLNKHSHLYTSNELIDFPGRVFKIEQHIVYNKSQMKSILANKKANISTRNFPETVENIKNKWKIKDGGNLFCFFTTIEKNEKIVLICTKTN